MGSRAVVDRLPRRGGGAASGSASPTASVGIVYTRTGRRFFDDADAGAALLDRVRDARSTRAGLWDELDTDWVLPRLRADAVVGQGAGAAARRSTRRRRGGARRAAAARRRAGARPPARGVDVGDAASTRMPRAASADVERFVAAYRRYCWPVDVARPT